MLAFPHPHLTQTLRTIIIGFYDPQTIEKIGTLKKLIVGLWNLRTVGTTLAEPGTVEIEGNKKVKQEISYRNNKTLFPRSDKKTCGDRK